MMMMIIVTTRNRTRSTRVGTCCRGVVDHLNEDFAPRAVEDILDLDGIDLYVEDLGQPGGGDVVDRQREWIARFEMRGAASGDLKVLMAQKIPQEFSHPLAEAPLSIPHLACFDLCLLCFGFPEGCKKTQINLVGWTKVCVCVSV